MCQIGIKDSLIKGNILEEVAGKFVLKNIIYCGVNVDDSPDELDVFDVSDFDDLSVEDLVDIVADDHIEDIALAVSEAAIDGNRF